MSEKILLPYLVIARINNLTKDNPEDDNDMVWIDKNGNRFVLTPKGFVSAVQYSYISLFKHTKSELEKITSEYLSLKEQQEKFKGLKEKIKSEVQDELGKKSKRHILGVIDNVRGNYTDAEKLGEIKRYLNFKANTFSK